MKKILLIAILLSVKIHAQEATGVYVNIYKYSDSIRNNKLTGKISLQAIKTADSLNKLPPKAYFEKTVELLLESNYNDAAYIWLIGDMRKHYCDEFIKFDKPFYELYSEVKEPVYMYLRSNIDNYVALIKLSADYHKSHDYAYKSGKLKQPYYDEAGDIYRRFGIQFSAHKAYFENLWKKEREDEEPVKNQK